MEYTRLPEEYKYPPEYNAPPTEQSGPECEFSHKAGEAKAGISDTRKRLKRLLFIPAASILAALSLLLSSLGLDPLGSDFLTTGKLSGAPLAGFPALSNLAPDFSGAYAWGGIGSEEYVRFMPNPGDVYSYLEMGGAWVSMGSTDAAGNYVPNTLVTPANAAYDPATNTLTLTNFSAHELDVNLMGNGFRIELVGSNVLDRLCVWGAYYGGSVTLTGSGTLTVNKSGNSGDGVGIRLQGEFSQSCLMIDRGATVDVYGSPAILIGATSMEQSLYWLSPVEMTGGEMKNGDFAQYSAPIYDANGNYLGNKPLTISEISKRDGIAWYDSSVVDENGNASAHVRFAPAE